MIDYLGLAYQSKLAGVSYMKLAIEEFNKLSDKEKLETLYAMILEHILGEQLK